MLKYVSVRNEAGDKLVVYSENSDWNELFTGDDLYETNNKINNPAYASLLAKLRADLQNKLWESGFLRIHGVRRDHGFPLLELEAGEAFEYAIDVSSDGEASKLLEKIEGSGAVSSFELFEGPPANWAHTVTSEVLDYGLTGENTSIGQGELEMIVGQQGDKARNAVLVFALPPPPAPGAVPSHAQLQVFANKRFH